jgi:hypothetical protein
MDRRLERTAKYFDMFKSVDEHVEMLVRVVRLDAPRLSSDSRRNQYPQPTR